MQDVVSIEISSYISICEPSNYSLLVISCNPLKSFLSREITELNHLVRKKMKRQSLKKSFIKTKHKTENMSLAKKNYILPEKIYLVLQIMHIQLHFFFKLDWDFAAFLECSYGIILNHLMALSPTISRGLAPLLDPLHWWLLPPLCSMSCRSGLCEFRVLTACCHLLCLFIYFPVAPPASFSTSRMYSMPWNQNQEHQIIQKQHKHWLACVTEGPHKHAKSRNFAALFTKNSSFPAALPTFPEVSALRKLEVHEAFIWLGGL